VGPKRAVAGRSLRARRGLSHVDPEAAALFAWYAGVRLKFKTIAPGDLLASFWDEVTPVLWPLGEAPTDDDVAAHPDRFFRDEAGESFVKPPLAQPEPGLEGVVVLTLDSAGIAVVNRREATHDRERAQHLLPDGDDVAVHSLRRLAVERMPSGRRDGLSPTTGKPWRRGHDVLPIARALVVLRLVDLGHEHRAAIRAWLWWEHELGGEYGNAYALEDLRKGRTVMSRPYEDQVAAFDRRVWEEMAANLYPKNDSSGPDNPGHDQDTSGRSQRRR
jgi:hypothetical protein